jgi:Ca2+-binding EF-hand superfamily protein
MFLKETLQATSQMAEMMVKEKMNDTKSIMANFRALFMAADTNSDGQLTQEELTRVLQFEKVKLWLAKLGVDASDPESLFHLLDADGNGEISVETFLTCVKRLKGEARAQDLIPVVHDCKQILKHCMALRDDHRKLSILLKQKEQEESLL